jgi:NAD(P)-dependent dehydrogenase (short-subunit alcohol dehydrogenase family)
MSSAWSPMWPTAPRSTPWCSAWWPTQAGSINVTSYTGLRGNLGQSDYAMAKSGIIGFTKTTAPSTTVSPSETRQEVDNG